MTQGRNTRAWRRISAQVRAEETHCHICGTEIDPDLDSRHPMSFTADHLIPTADLDEDDPRREDRNYVRAAHRKCNAARAARGLHGAGYVPSRDW